ncbi:MAG: hypothetical protein ACOX6N_00855 [Patescibacteria group bacterium]|jgi:hypothetical protein
MTSQFSNELLNKAKSYLSPQQKDLITDLDTVNKLLKQNHISDYSFLVAPAAKAYEGYLKDFFLKIGIIDRSSYESDRFRVGKTLNPSLRYKRFSIFQKLTDLHEKGEELAEILWDAWKFGRNEILHYFPHNLKSLNKQEADERIALILSAIVKSSQFVEENQTAYSKML